jgi:very-short-patch-repair endonuclease
MHALDNLATGVVRCVFSPAPLATVERLLARGASCPEDERIVACEVDLSRPVYEMAGTLIRALARAALAVWPDWYGDADQFRPCDEPSLQATLDRLASARTARRQRFVLRPWVSRAVSSCRAGILPVVPAFSPTVQARQLALAVADALTVVVRAVSADGPEPAGLLGLARNLEWLARHTSARVVAALPIAWSARSELDAISWEGRTFDEVEPASNGTEPALDEPLASVRPIRGRPHPDSPGEQLMASHLRRDPVLGPLFEYNVPVTTVRGSRYQVDLVWFDGKVAVEIDSYRWHSSPTNFANDRHRDYELQLSGFLVLRLTHSSVMGDVELAVDKVRDLVKLRAGQPLPPPRPGA